ncbi:hypothetical protein FQ087_15810 [Sporosarcina sp. ANT_H38]|uniref:DUF6054 family protein n=1 Tax=Sporosarcina sp. ANT_H38 TaxID=2597358 RepID=UPI0011F21129|nr:DUF6054 family protein [Sporosarcina sp. ANT_H38]KAA0948476.1 hypothetical protein FQ087_15810 [Sporosarcina sp. ANT_H38]
MSVREFTVTISPAAATDVIESYVIRGNISGTLVDRYVRQLGEQEVHVIVLEKYYMRSSNRASLTVTTDNFGGQTKVHAVASGSSEGVFMRFDWGAGKDFANSVESALGSYIVW